MALADTAPPSRGCPRTVSKDEPHPLSAAHRCPPVPRESAAANRLLRTHETAAATPPDLPLTRTPMADSEHPPTCRCDTSRPAGRPCARRTALQTAEADRAPTATRASSQWLPPAIQRAARHHPP